MFKIDRSRSPRFVRNLGARSLVGGLVVTVSVVSGLSSSAPMKSQGSQQISFHSSALVSPSTLMVTDNVYKALMSSPSTAAILANTKIYLVVSPDAAKPTSPNVIPVVKYTNAATATSALVNHNIPSWVQGLVYDPEAWSLTPISEQENPVGAVEALSGPVHSAGLRFIVTPGLDLAKYLNSTGTYAQRILASGMLAQMAPYVDVLELQSQSLELNTTEMANFIGTEFAAIRHSSPSVTVLSGVSTNAGSTVPTANQLAAAIAVAGEDSQGFWLNVPTRGTACPNCGTYDPLLANTALAMEYSSVG